MNKCHLPWLLLWLVECNRSHFRNFVDILGCKSNFIFAGVLPSMSCRTMFVQLQRNIFFLHQQRKLEIINEFWHDMLIWGFLSLKLLRGCP
ncbi:uncharacterized protein DS421_20g694780 [Arachis hypogaea]|nr:uncharacterized protein DS421_20g694780 [Arachis hypogaea]